MYLSYSAVHRYIVRSVCLKLGRCVGRYVGRTVCGKVGRLVCRWVGGWGV